MRVRSCGTEGRKKDGPQVLPSDRVYDYILFRGSDIKDLQVNPSPSAQPRQEIQSEQATNQSSHSGPAMSSPVFDYDRGLGRGKQWVQTPALSSKSVPLSFHPPSANVGSLRESPVSLIASTRSNAGSSMPMPSFVQANKLASTGAPLGMIHQAVTTLTMHNDPQIRDEFASPTMGLLNDTSQVVIRKPAIASVPSYSSNPSPLGQAQRHTPPDLASLPSNPSPLSATQLSASNIQNSYPIVSQAIRKVANDSLSNHPNRSIHYELPALTPDSAPVIPGPLSNLPLVQSRQQMVNMGEEMFGATSPVSVDVQSQSPATGNYAPLLPPQISAHQFRIPSSTIDFTEEFDFHAMNEKFNKSELWGFFGKSNQSKQNDYGEKTAVEPNVEGKTKLQQAYNKDDFFDTISCNSVDRMARSGQQQLTQFPEHMGQNSEVFGNHFQRPPQLQPGQGAYLAAQTNYRGGYDNNNYSNSGYGYYYGGRGRGRNTHF